MSAVRLQQNVSSITVGGTALTPAGNKVVPANDAHATILAHHTTRPRFKQAAANGDITITLPSIVSSITLGGIVYTPNGSGDITVPALVGTAYLNELKYTNF